MKCHFEIVAEIKLPAKIQRAKLWLQLNNERMSSDETATLPEITSIVLFRTKMNSISGLNIYKNL